MIIDACAVNIGGVVNRYVKPTPVVSRTTNRMVGNCRRRKFVKDVTSSAGEAISDGVELPALTAGSDLLV